MLKKCTASFFQVSPFFSSSFEFLFPSLLYLCRSLPLCLSLSRFWRFNLVLTFPNLAFTLSSAAVNPPLGNMILFRPTSPRVVISPPPPQFCGGCLAGPRASGLGSALSSSECYLVLIQCSDFPLPLVPSRSLQKNHWSCMKLSIYEMSDHRQLWATEWMNSYIFCTHYKDITRLQ